MDPFRMLKKWKSCPLHQSKSKMPSLALSAVWSYINGGAVLQGAHDSLVDAKAQSDLLVNEAFVPFIDRTDSFSPIEKIFGANELSAMKRVLEPIRPVHKPWEELTAESTLEWAPRGDFSYTGSHGGAVECGPSSAVKLKGISESSFPLDGELIYGPVYTDSYVEIFPGPNYYHNYTSYIDNGNTSI